MAPRISFYWIRIIDRQPAKLEEWRNLDPTELVAFLKKNLRFFLINDSKTIFNDTQNPCIRICKSFYFSKSIEFSKYST